MTSPAPESLLAHRPFVLFWFARVASTVAYQMLAVAIGWQLYNLTGNPLDLGLVGLAQFLPAALLMLVVGQVADRYDRRAILSICQTIEAVMALTLLAGSAAGWLTRDLFLLAAFILGAARAFELTALQTLVPNLVPPALMPRAVAGSATANQAATIAGPAIGGFLYAAGPVLVYATCAALFVIAGTLAILIHLERAAARREPVTLTALFAGIGYVRRHPLILGAISLDLFAVLAGGATALFPVYARDVFAAGPSGLGLLRAAPAIGALMMAIALTRWSFERHAGRILFAGVAVYGAAIVVVGLSTSLAIAIAALIVLGAADMISVVIRMTLIQLQTPDEMRGRVTAVNAFFITTANQLGDFKAGAAAAWLGVVPAVVLGGVGTLMVVGLWMKLFPALVRVDKLAPAQR